MTEPTKLPPLPEPDAYLFQHEETGLTEYVCSQQVEWGFEKANPRWKKIHGAFTEQQLKAYATAALQSQDREDAERLQYLLRRVCMYQTASYGCKFEILNLPPHFGDCEPDPIPPFLAAIDHARRIEDKP